jgi:cyclase
MQPTSRHFQIEPLAEGVYVALAREGGGAWSNAGIVDLGDRTLLFDTLALPQAARDLVNIAHHLTHRPITLAVNSHWHLDHVAGNQVLPPTTTIVSTQRTRALIADRLPPQTREQQTNVPRQLRELEAELQTTPNPARREEIGKEIDRLRMVLHDLPSLSVRLPDLAFEHKLLLHGTTRRAELLTFGGGHTESDAILYLPHDQIAFVGDLLFHHRHPWIGDGSPDVCLRIYDQIDALDPPVEVLVPGHGPVATPSAFAALRRYVPALRQIAEDVVRGGGTEADALNRAVPAAFSEWDGLDTFKANMAYFYRQALAAAQASEPERAG